MLTLTPFKSLVRWYHKLLGRRAPWVAPVGSHQQERGVPEAGIGEPRALAGKWPDQGDVMTRLTTSDRVIRLNGSRTARDAGNSAHETRMHHDTRMHNVYKFPGI